MKDMHPPFMTLQLKTSHPLGICISQLAGKCGHQKRTTLTLTTIETSLLFTSGFLVANTIFLVWCLENLNSSNIIILRNKKDALPKT